MALALVLQMPTCACVKMKALLVLVCVFHVSTSLDNGLGKMPQIGWNFWNHFDCCTVDAQIVMDTVDGNGETAWLIAVTWFY